jgi:hypothetical protein
MLFMWGRSKSVLTFAGWKLSKAIMAIMKVTTWKFICKWGTTTCQVQLTKLHHVWPNSLQCWTRVENLGLVLASWLCRKHGVSRSKLPKDEWGLVQAYRFYSILIMSVYTRQITDAANLNSMTCITGSVIFEVWWQFEGAVSVSVIGYFRNIIYNTALYHRCYSGIWLSMTEIFSLQSEQVDAVSVDAGTEQITTGTMALLYFVFKMNNCACTVQNFICVVF